MSILSIENIAFTAIGYPVSYIELVGTVFNLVSVVLVARRNIWTWPTGLVAVALFFALFYQARLYSDMVEQAYFFATSIWGWWAWSKAIPPTGELRGVRLSPRSELLRDASILAAGTIALGLLTSNFHVLWPALFSAPADLPYLDALTTVASFIATWQMIRFRTECWILWIAVDVIGIGLYAYKGLWMLSILYAIFLCLASWGLAQWLRAGRR